MRIGRGDSYVAEAEGQDDRPDSRRTDDEGGQQGDRGEGRGGDRGNCMHAIVPVTPISWYKIDQKDVFGGSSPLAGITGGCRQSCKDGTLDNNEEYVDCGGDFHCAKCGCAVLSWGEFHAKSSRVCMLLPPLLLLLLLLLLFLLLILSC